MFPVKRQYKLNVSYQSPTERRNCSKNTQPTQAENRNEPKTSKMKNDPNCTKSHQLILHLYEIPFSLVKIKSYPETLDDHQKEEKVTTPSLANPSLLVWYQHICQKFSNFCISQKPSYINRILSNIMCFIKPYNISVFKSQNIYLHHQFIAI